MFNQITLVLLASRIRSLQVIIELGNEILGITLESTNL